MQSTLRAIAHRSAYPAVPRHRRGGRTLQALLAGCLALLLSGVSPGLAAAEITATLDRDRIVEGETVTLVVQTDDPKQSLDTNLDRLSADFALIDQRTETQMSIVNGRQSASVRLLLTLEPKRTGRLTIPSLEFRGGLRTAPRLLTVEPAPQLAPGEQAPVFIEVEVDPLEGPYYVHAQLSLKVRIFYQQNLTEAAINPPAPAQASVRLLDEVPYQADRNGTRYRVLERRYAIFPERSGELLVPPLQLTGRLIERPADRLWQPSVRGRRVRIESDLLLLDILPRPAQYSGDRWLPARRLELAQQITDGDEIRVGEPVTRTILIDAVGLEEHMIEEPAWPELADARIYPDQPQGISRDDGQWVLGHREYRYAVVPETSGTLVLPELRLVWWDTVNDRERVAVLPEHRVTVLPSELAQLPPPGGLDGFSEDSGTGLPPANQTGLLTWQLLSALLAAGWLLTTLYLLKRRDRRGAVSTASPPATAAEKTMLEAIRKAARDDQARDAHLALGSWLRHYGPPAAAGSLSAFASKLDDGELAQSLRQLDAAAYGQQDVAWDGKAFWRRFEAWQKAGGGRPGKATMDGPDDLDLYAAR